MVHFKKLGYFKVLLIFTVEGSSWEGLTSHYVLHYVDTLCIYYVYCETAVSNNCLIYKM